VLFGASDFARIQSDASPRKSNLLALASPQEEAMLTRIIERHLGSTHPDSDK
jgi:hypothetical protein